jgi:hypothetical protein
MLRSQRIVLVLAFVLAAWLLHTNTCDWVVKESVEPARALCAWEHDLATTMAAIKLAGHSLFPLHTGLVVERDVDYTMAVAVGLAAPILLLASAVHLLLGWKATARLRGGCCVKCGYDLRGLKGPFAKCPECGASATNAA